jgi:hypothetical protein
MFVNNIIGSSRYSAPSGYSSWLEYWEDKSGKKAYSCGTSNCKGKDLVGAHVQKAYSNDNKWYIVPLCKSCNNRTDIFFVEHPLVPVPSNL